MAYRIENCTGTAGEITEISRFLADFVNDGEGPQADEAGRTPQGWQNRLQWWWKENPFCKNDSPKGLLLYQEDTIVGFFGLIPHDYTLKGEIIPTLITTTAFVREAHRRAALGLFMRAHRLEGDFHFVDGCPSREIDNLLLRSGYCHEADGKLMIFPIRKSNWDIKSWALRAAGFLGNRKGKLPENGNIVTSLDRVSRIAAFPDGRIRKKVTLESLAWYLSSGSSNNTLLGWCDESGTLRSYLIGRMMLKKGLESLVILDYAAADEEAEEILWRLAAHVSAHPEEANLPKKTDIMVWPVCGEVLKRTTPFVVKYESRLFYRLPQSRSGVERLCLPFEGDPAFL